MGIPARRRRFQAAAHRQGRRRRPDRRLPGARRIHRRPPHPGRPPGHGRGHVARRRSVQAVRPAGHALGVGRNLVQVPRLLPPHASGGRRAATAARAWTEPGRYRARGHARAPGRDRRAAGDRSAHRASIQVLDGHGAGAGCAAGPRRAGGIRRRTDDERVAAFRQRVVMELDPEVDAACSAGSARSRSIPATGASCAAWTNRAIPATRCPAPRSKTRRCAWDATPTPPRKRTAR